MIGKMAASLVFMPEVGSGLTLRGSTKNWHLQPLPQIPIQAFSCQIVSIFSIFPEISSQNS